MKVALLATAALLGLLAVPAPAQAHDCDLDNAPCVVQCIVHAVTSGDTCGVDPMDPPTVASCAPGETGVIVVFDGRSARVCAPTPTAGTAPCPPGETGIIVLVNGRPFTACANL